MFDAPDGLKGYVGEEDGFDPLKLSSAFDMVRRPPACLRLPEMRCWVYARASCLVSRQLGCVVCQSHRRRPAYRLAFTNPGSSTVRGGQSGRLTCCRLAWHGTPTGPCRA